MTSTLIRQACVVTSALLAALPALAQYKVVDPNGSVTYTDRPPYDGTSRVTPLSRQGGPANTEVGLPIELRQAAQRYPVTLYTAAECPPCDSGRRLLQQHGIPYSERLIVGEDDTLALERLVGSRAVPALTIGAQPLRGYVEPEWLSFLDAAGYPKESKLPRRWPQPVPTPLVEKVVAGRTPATTPTAPAEPAPVAEPTPTAPGVLRF